MRNMANFAKLLMVALILVAFAPLAQAQGPGPVNQGPGDAAAAAVGGPRTGINTDIPFDGDVICGFSIIVTVDQAPQSIYHGTRNPWPNPPFPIITQVGWNPNRWLLEFGGPNGPCFPRSLFFEGTEPNKVFKGLHFGFNTPLTLVQFQNSPCWTYNGAGALIPCSGITGHDVHGWGLNVLNGAAADIGIGNVEVAFSQEVIDIDILTRGDLGHLDWEPVRLETGIVPARGSLQLTVPEHLRNRGGWAVFSYDITDPETFKHLSTATLQFKLP
jgi:hypothetical protein